MESGYTKYLLLGMAALFALLLFFAKRSTTSLSPSRAPVSEDFGRNCIDKQQFFF